MHSGCHPTREGLHPHTSGARAPGLASALLRKLRAQFNVAAGSFPTAVDLTVPLLSYPISPAALEELIRDVRQLANRVPEWPVS